MNSDVKEVPHVPKETLVPLKRAYEGVWPDYVDFINGKKDLPRYGLARVMVELRTLFKE